MKRRIQFPEYSFSFDRVEFCSSEHAKNMKLYIDRKSISNLFTGKINLKRTNDSRKYFYNSFFGGRPKNNNYFLSIIDKKLNGIDAILTYIEIAKDISCKNENEAIALYNRKKSTTYLKYSGFNISIMKFEKNPEKGFFHDELVRIGIYRRFQLVIYPRYCKETGKSVLRIEFRISRNKKILSNLNVLHQKFIPNPKSCYHYLSKRYLKHGTLNRRKVKNLLLLRGEYINICDLISFCQFITNERNRDLSSEKEEYVLRLNRSLSYYMD